MKNYSLLIIILFLILLLFKYFIYFPLGFDGAYNLEIPKNLYLSGEYKTNIAPFDVFITTGYPVLLPIFLSFKIFGLGLIQAKIIMFAFFILFIFSLFLIFKIYIGYRLIIFLSLLTTLVLFFGFVPGSMHFIFEVIGELPALTFFLLSLLSFRYGYRQNKRLSKKWMYFALSGLLLGFAVETKIIMILSLVSYFGTLFLFFFYSNNKVEFIKNILISLYFFIIPFVVFRAYQLTQMGWESFIINQRNLFNFLKNNGSGLNGLNQDITSFELLKQHIGTTTTELGINLAILVAIFLIIVAILIHSIYKKKFLLINLSTFILLFSVWWFFINTSIWIRHYAIAIIAIIILLSLLLGQFLYTLKTKFKNGRVGFIVPAMIAIFLSAIIIQSSISSFKVVFHINHYKNQLNAQMAMGHFIKENLNNSDIYYRGWWQAPEISFMAEKSFIDLNRSDHIKSYPAYLILTNLQYRLDNKSYEKDLKMCSNDVLFQNNNDIICRIRDEN